MWEKSHKTTSPEDLPFYPYICILYDAVKNQLFYPRHSHAEIWCVSGENEMDLNNLLHEGAVIWNSC